MTHYACPACGGTSDHPKACDTEGCSLKGQPLKECHCTDNEHAEIKNQQTE